MPYLPSGHKFKAGEMVKVRSGKVYKIRCPRTDDHRDFKGEPGYDARQLRDGKLYGAERIFPESALAAL